MKRVPPLRVCSFLVGFGIATLLVSRASRAQSESLPQHFVRVDLATGPHDNPASTAVVVWQQYVDFGTGTPWARFLLRDAKLPPGSALRVTSLLDGETQALDLFQMGQWGHTTAYLNGSQFAFELLAGPGTEGTEVTIESAIVGDTLPDTAAVPETICGNQDNRAPTTERSICRLLTGSRTNPQQNSGCTGFMVNVTPGGNAADRLLLTAGHCLVPGGGNPFQVSTVAQFNVPLSLANCGLQHPPLVDQFPVTVIVGAVNVAPGNDWGVFRCGLNNNNQTSFQRQSALPPFNGPVPLPLATAANFPANGVGVRVDGYGVDSSNVLNAGNPPNPMPPPQDLTCLCSGGATGTWNQTLQSHLGSLVNGANPVQHDVDTCGANSGSPIYTWDFGTNDFYKVVGIHTHGGCTVAAGTTNEGTRILLAALQAAIQLGAAPPGPGPNNECAGATVVQNGVNAGFSNAVATTSAPAWPCGGGANDVWFIYVATCTGSTTFDTCPPGTNYDTTLEVFAGACTAGPLVSLACNDDACGTRSRVTIQTFAGSAYLIRVGGFNGATGNFDLAVTPACAPGPACAVFFENFEGPGLGAYVETNAAGAAAATLWHDETLCPSPVAPFAVAAVAPPAVFPSIVGNPGAIVIHGPLVDDAVGVIGVPIAFNFWGAPLGAANVDSNGPVSVAAISDFSNDPIPNAAAPNEWVSAWWDDNHTGPAGSVVYDVVGGSLVIEWNVEHFPGGNGSGEFHNFQVRLNPAPANSISLLYNRATFAGGVDPWSATIGVEDAAGAVGVDATGLGAANAVPPANDLVLIPAGAPVALPPAMGAKAAAYNRGDLGVYDYVTGAANAGCIRSPLVDTFPNAVVTLTFDYMKETEGGGVAAFDACFVEARTLPIPAPPAPWAYVQLAQIVPNSPCPNVATATVAVPGVQRFWQHRFRFDTVDAVANGFHGWYVDNVLATQASAAGGFAIVATGCGPGPGFAPSGTPGIGGTVSFGLVGVVGVPVLWLGAPIPPVPLCPGCSLGASLGIVFAAPGIAATIPCDPALAGAVIALQGADLFAAGGCPATVIGVPFTVSNTIVMTIG
jgi:hypothetical protein